MGKIEFKKQKYINIIINTLIVNNSESVQLEGEGEYNLNSLKVIEVTESYIGMDNGCQNGESLQDCATNHFVGKVLEQCGCLPFNIRLSEKVSY